MKVISDDELVEHLKTLEVDDALIAMVIACRAKPILITHPAMVEMATKYADLLAKMVSLKAEPEQAARWKIIREVVDWIEANRRAG